MNIKLNGSAINLFLVTGYSSVGMRIIDDNISLQQKTMLKLVHKLISPIELSGQKIHLAYWQYS